MNKKFLKNKSGFTLLEVLVTIGILSFCLCGLMLTYANMFIFSDLSRGFSLAHVGIQARIEEIKNFEFDDLDLHNGETFDLDGFSAADSEAVIQVNNTAYANDLRRVRLVASFRSRNRLIGEDSNLNGILDAGEDSNNNARLDSPVEAIILISR